MKEVTVKLEPSLYRALRQHALRYTTRPPSVEALIPRLLMRALDPAPGPERFDR